MAFGAPAPQWISLKSGQAGGDRNRGERRAENGMRPGMIRIDRGGGTDGERMERGETEESK